MKLLSANLCLNLSLPTTPKDKEGDERCNIKDGKKTMARLFTLALR
jgi:hypothetical protein